ncbi:MAG: NUDIX hydrolase [Acidimicrobiia bacterium]
MDERTVLLALLDDHPPVDEREAHSIATARRELDRLPFPFDEHADLTHVTASAIVIGTRGVVLHKHKRLGLWLQPGGHIETGETMAEGALREAAEETGLAVRHLDRGPRFVHLDVHPGPRGHTHLDVRYVLVAPPDDPTPPDGESPDVRWFSWDDAIAIAEPGLIGALSAAKAFR